MKETDSCAARAPVEAGVVTREEHGDPLDPETGEPVPHTGGSTHYECYACELVNSPYGARYESRPTPPADLTAEVERLKTLLLEERGRASSFQSEMHSAICRARAAEDALPDGEAPPADEVAGLPK